MFFPIMYWGYVPTPMAFPQAFSSILTCPKHLPYPKSLLSHIFSQHFSPSLPGPTFHSITIYLQCLNSLYPTLNSSLLSTWPNHLNPVFIVISLQQCHQLPVHVPTTHLLYKFLSLKLIPKSHHLNILN